MTMAMILNNEKNTFWNFGRSVREKKKGTIRGHVETSDEMFERPRLQPTVSKRRLPGFPNFTAALDHNTRRPSAWTQSVSLRARGALTFAYAPASQYIP